MLTSIIIRTFNEQQYLDELLSKITEQESKLSDIEVVIVDSGSTDRTLEIAEKHECRITHIPKKEFTFGRSLNIGCEFSRGDIFVFVSGHCIPANRIWLDELIKPIIDGKASYTYGRQEAFGHVLHVRELSHSVEITHLNAGTLVAAFYPTDLLGKI